MKRFALALSIFMLIPLSAVTASKGRKVINAQAFGSTPNITIRGVVSGGAPWVLKNGKITLDTNGRLKARVRGLVIGDGALANGNPVPPNLIGTVAGITTVHAALTCGGPGGGVPFTITPTDGVPIDAAGNFQIDAQITVPTVCAQPIVLIRIGAPAANGPWIAASELPGRGPDDDDDDDDDQNR
ncbi:MAG TPA: hypothetical protein VNS63_28015 [Blastocatellia bacterium]|nr:hypothetical protein [Blastocatellia bacterium]